MWPRAPSSKEVYCFAEWIGANELFLNSQRLGDFFTGVIR